MQRYSAMRLKRIVKKGLDSLLGPFGLEVRKKSDARLLEHYDKQVRDTVEFVKPYTMTPAFKTAELCEAVRYLEKSNIPGAFVECGVWRGGSMMAAALTLKQANAANRELFLFDTFAGMPEPTEEDVSLSSGMSAKDKFEEKSVSGTGSDWCYASIEDVRSNMAKTGYPESQVHFVPGMVEQTIPVNAPEQIALLRLDTDWYESTIHELDCLYDRIQHGGILIVDDYDSWKGSRKAVDEFIENRSAKLFLHRMGGRLGRIAVVP